MSSDLTITISSVEDCPSDSTKYKKLSRTRYRVKQPVTQLNDHDDELIRQSTEQKSADVKKDEYVPVRTTRGGRVVRKPVRYEPVETVNDDFPDSDHDTDYDSEA